MALGKNLKKKKLLPHKEDRQVIEPKKVFKKVIGEPVEKKSIPHPPLLVTEKKNLPEEITDMKLPAYIARELLERKKHLRNKYTKEVAALKGYVIQLVIIQIGEERYAIEINNVKEVVLMPKTSKAPNTPSHITGITIIRRNTYVVFDLADKFKVKSDPSPEYLLVLNNRKINACLTLGALPFTLKVNGDDISSDMQTIEYATLDASYIKGIIQHNKQLIYYLDIVRLIKNEKAIAIPDDLLVRAHE